MFTETARLRSETRGTVRLDGLGTVWEKAGMKQPSRKWGCFYNYPRSDVAATS